MIGSALAKTHGFFHSYATKMAKHPGIFFGLGMVKTAIGVSVLGLYKQYENKYGDSIHTSRHNSIEKDMAEDAALGVALTGASLIGAKVYANHEKWHPKDKRSAGKEPDGAEAASDESAAKRPRTSREARALEKGLPPWPGAKSTFTFRM
jgi:hypothetical protein